ncbi:hypothetical protein VTI74DRAFT_9279 [Chaetomium olivicolor]
MDDKKPPAEAEDAVMQQSYPSPMVDSADAQYYHQLAQHRELEPQIDHQSAQPEEHHGLAALPEHQAQHQHHELHELQSLQEPPTPQQHNSRPPVSADELQLAAQLTQGLAPMMAAAVQEQAEEQQQLPQQDGQAQTQPGAEPNLQEQLEASLQDHEQLEASLRNQEHDLQTHNHELQSVLSHEAPPQPHHYPQNHPAVPHLPHNMSLEHLPPTHPQYQLSDATPPRKRSKVSRACDECRRKKIKCDAQSEATEQPCSNCRRSNAHCLFSRVPQKRGPSKGYIKELADRINTIEGKLNTSVENLERRASSEAFASPGLGDNSRKRPFSSISGDGFQTPPPTTMASGHTSEHLPIWQPESRPRISGNPSDLALRPLPPMQFTGESNDGGLPAQTETMDGISQNGLPQGSAHHAEHLPEIEDAVFNRYLEVIHPVFPVLASSKARVQSLLWQSPVVLQSAFYNAFFSMLQPFLPYGTPQIHGDTATVCRLLSEWDGTRRPRSAVTDLVRLQTLIMAVIAVDSHGIPAANVEPPGPSKASFLGQVVALGMSMRLYAREVDLEPNADLDPNSDDNVALRAWWALVMLDRWNAVGMGMPVLINNDTVVIRPGLQNIVGDVVFALIRQSHFLGHIGPLVAGPAVLDPFTPAGSMQRSWVRTIADTLRWYLPAGNTDPVLHLAYWHARLLYEILSSDPSSANILQVSKKMVELLLGNHDLVSPLTHHFVALVSLVLLDLHRFDETRDEAAKMIETVLGFRLAYSAWNTAVREKLAGCQSRPGTAVSSGPASQNLQHLADLATTVEGSTAAGAATAATEDGPKEEPLVNGNSTAPAALLGQGLGINGDFSCVPGGEVRSALRKGYLTSFGEKAEDGLAA